MFGLCAGDMKENQQLVCNLSFCMYETRLLRE
jgi:hypothetical protein